MKLRGRVVPIATPLTTEERVNEMQLRQLVDFLLDKGAHGIWANGGFGGFAHLRDEEQIRAVDIVIDQVGKRVPVLACISDTSVTRVIEKAERISALGPDCLGLLPPYYGMWNSRQLIVYYEDVARHVDLPLYIYNDPWSTHVPIDANTIFALSHQPNIVGIKDSSEDPYQYVALAQRFKGSDFTLLAGTMPLGCYVLSLGFDGVVDPTDNIYADLGVALFHLAEAGNWIKALAIQAKIDKVGRVIMGLGDYRAAVEAGMVMLGLCDRISPRPLPSLQDQKQLAELREVLGEVGVLPSSQ